ncbi:DUF3000 domain-containing protein [Dermabacteraceae bacterium P13077]
MTVHRFPPAREAFLLLQQQMTAAPMRPEVSWQEIPAPAQLAPFSFAASADVEFQGEDVASGRFILLHDPAGQENWDGQFRIVTLVNAQLEPEFATEAMLGDVAWSWVTESLELNDAQALQLGCTVTRVVSQSYGSLAIRPSSVDAELRASWTPEDPQQLAAHFAAWGSLMCAAGGLPPLPVEVSPLTPTHRARSPRCQEVTSSP